MAIRLVVTLLWLFLAGSCSRDGAEPRTDFLSFHWVANPEVLDARTCLLPSGQPIQVEPEPLVDLTHVKSARIDADGGGAFQVVLELEPGGQARLREVTTQGVGQRLAIVVDSLVVALPLIQRPIDSGEFPLMPSTEEAATELARRISEAVADRKGAV